MRVVVSDALAGERVDRLVALVTGIARAEAAGLVDAGAVSIGGRPVTTRSHRVNDGDEIDVELPTPSTDAVLEPDPTVVFDVVHADDAVIVVDKPPGLVVHPGSGNRSATLVHGLVARYPDIAEQTWPDAERPGVVHRLDKGTSGLLVMARTPAVLATLSMALRERRVERRYLALVWGTVEAGAGVVDAPVGRSERDRLRMTVRADGRRAVTRYEVLTRYNEPVPATLVSCLLETGRTHQIRVHMAAIGHPVAGDDRYRRGGVRATGLNLRRPFLHAERLAFAHPTSGEAMSFTSAMPSDLAAVVDQLS